METRRIMQQGGINMMRKEEIFGFVGGVKENDEGSSVGGFIDKEGGS